MKQRSLISVLGIIIFTAAIGADAAAEVIEKTVDVGPIDLFFRILAEFEALLPIQKINQLINVWHLSLLADVT